MTVDDYKTRLDRAVRDARGAAAAAQVAAEDVARLVRALPFTRAVTAQMTAEVLVLTRRLGRLLPALGLAVARDAEEVLAAGDAISDNADDV